MYTLGLKYFWLNPRSHRVVWVFFFLITISSFTAKHRNSKGIAGSPPFAASLHGLENCWSQQVCALKIASPLLQLTCSLLEKYFYPGCSATGTHSAERRRAACAVNTCRSSAWWREISRRSHPQQSSFSPVSVAVLGCGHHHQDRQRTVSFPCFGAHLLQLLVCTGHSSWVGALGSFVPCQKLPMSLLVRTILLLRVSQIGLQPPKPLVLWRSCRGPSLPHTELSQYRAELQSNLVVVGMAS